MLHFFVRQVLREFAKDLAHEEVEHITLNPIVAIITVVGDNMRGTPGIASRTCDALSRENVNVLAIALGSSECNVSLVVAKKDMKASLVAAHEEFFAKVHTYSK